MQMRFQKAYDDGVMYVTVDGFSTWALMVSEMFLDCTRKQRSAWIVPARYCGMRFINSSHYIPEDNSTEIQRRTQPRENNVSFLQMSSHDSASETKNYWITAVNALRNIDIVEELYINNGSEHSFPQLRTQ